MRVSEKIHCIKINKYFLEKSRKDQFLNINNSVLEKIAKQKVHIIMKTLKNRDIV